MYGNSSLGTIFTLMPLDEKYQESFKADWSFVVVDKAERLVAFRDKSRGEVTRRHWDFGDQTTSEEQHPVHRYKNPGKYVVVLTIEGPEGTSRMANVWDVAVE
jgi:hypothetical protein